MPVELPTTKRFNAAVILVNSVDVARLPLILRRLMGGLHLRSGSTFAAAEEEQLSAMLGLNAESLHTVLESCSFVLEQFAYAVTKPTEVAAVLTAAGFADEHVVAWQEAWAEGAEVLLGQLRNQQFGPRVLDSVNWELSLGVADDSTGGTAQPTALIELAVKDAQEGGAADEKLAFEADHAEVRVLFDKLERIQAQLDVIS